MKILKSHIQLTALALSFIFTNAVLAAEPTTNESKDNQAANSETASPVAQADTAVSAQQASQPQAINDAQSYHKQMDERRQQVQVAQQEAYNNFLEQRKQNIAAFNSNIPEDAQERHNEFIKQMEERRALNSNESKDNEAANTISTTDAANNTSSDTTPPVTQNADSEVASPVAQADTVVSDQQVSQPQDAQSYRQQMDERHQQAQKAQQEAYNNFLEQRKQYTAAFNNNIPADVQERRNELMKQMEERRALNIKMMEEHRKAAEERRAEMQQKMHRTSAAPESAGKA